MLNLIKNEIKDLLKNKHSIDVLVEEPKRNDYDLAIPLFQVARSLEKNVNEVFELVNETLLENTWINEVVFVNGFLNININKNEFSKSVLLKVNEEIDNYGVKEENGKTIVIDYSSPNIAKYFSVGHLRSTVIGNSLKKIYESQGYKVVGINHIGDWGTQFGKLIVAYEKWGSKEEVSKDPLGELQKLYVLFHEKADFDESLEQEARDVFKGLEDKNEKYLELWEWFKDESLKEFLKMYDILNVSFDSYNGESFYNDKMDAVIAELEEKGLTKIDDGATIVDLGEGMPPALVKRSDGATLYITRDLAALFYRMREYNFNKVIYVVGNEQKLHFNQLKEVVKLMGYDLDIEHINFGLVLVDGKKMSTREGKYQKLDQVIDFAVSGALKEINDKNPDLANPEEVARKIGVGAIIFNDLKNERHLNIEFDLEGMLRFEGTTGPYVQYSGVRMASLLRGEVIDLNNINFDLFDQTHYFELVKLIDEYPRVVERSLENSAPSVIAKYLLTLSQSFNHFYGREKINVEDLSVKNTNLLLIKGLQIVLKEGLALLGIDYLEAM